MPTKMFYPVLVLFMLTSLGCSPVNTPIVTRYQLTHFSVSPSSAEKIAAKPTLFISYPGANTGYHSSQMLYVEKPFQLKAFTKNAWIEPPAEMLFSLMVQSLQKSHYFSAVTSSPEIDQADYRLDSYLLSLQQSFITHPSQLELAVKVVLTKSGDKPRRISEIFYEKIPSLCDNPYGGALAANKATEAFTRKLLNFIKKQLDEDKKTVSNKKYRKTKKTK